MFYEVETEGIPYYVFSELQEIPGFVHVFTSRRTDSALKDARGPAEVALQKPDLLKVLGLSPEKFWQLNQIHSTRVLEIEPGDSDQRTPWPEADGTLLAGPGGVSVVRTADCLPILLVDPETRSTCLLHAGWRGTCGHIARVGLAQMLERTGRRSEGLIAAFGPGIRRCCYQVGGDVGCAFQKQAHDLDRIFADEHLDLAEANRLDLATLGVTDVLDCGVCTACQWEEFYSYRRRRDQGRLWTLAGFPSN